MASPTFEVDAETLSNSFCFELTETFLSYGLNLELPRQKFSGVEGSDWQIKICFKGDNTLCLIFRLIKRPFSASQELTFTIRGIDKQYRIRDYYDDDKFKNCDFYRSEEITLNKLRESNAINNGKIIITVTATLHRPVIRSMSSLGTTTLLNFKEFADCEPDFKFLFDNNQCISVHKEYMSTISPVFKAMFSHDTKEAQTGTIEVTDFSHDTVKAAIDVLYGHSFESKSLPEVIRMLRFFEKYFINSTVNQLKEWLINNTTVDQLKQTFLIIKLSRH